MVVLIVYSVSVCFDKFRLSSDFVSRMWNNSGSCNNNAKQASGNDARSLRCECVCERNAAIDHPPLPKES